MLFALMKLKIERENHGRWLRAAGGFVVALAIVLVGWGGTLTGVYRADVEEVGPATHNDPGYSLAEIRQKLAAESEEIELQRNGRFILRRTSKVVWEGVWRKEGDRLFLRAEVVNGVSVIPELQTESMRCATA